MATQPSPLAQYESSEPLKVRIETHRKYEERSIDLDRECRDRLELAGPESVLDIGCGPGDFLKYLREAGHQGDLTGVDNSKAMIAELLETTADCKPGIEGIVADASDLPVQDQAVDRVTARHMLYHVSDVSKALAEFQRILKPGGILLLTTNSRDSLSRIHALLGEMLFSHDFEPDPLPDAAFVIENAPEILAEAGLEAEETVLENALVFTDHEPIVAYCASTFQSLDIPQDPDLFQELESWLDAEAARRLNAMDGVWHDPKNVGIYVVRKPS
ncbi:MAG: class I SAM-dependent methyltransferase [Chloroflexota bacterium]